MDGRQIEKGISQPLPGPGMENAIVLPPASFWSAMFDIIFFSLFGVGIILTRNFHHHTILDNPIARVFGGNNLCIFIDFGPARIVSNALMGLSLAPYALYGFTLRLNMIHFGVRKMVSDINTVILAVGFLFSCCFGLAIGIQPQFDSPFSVYIHTTGFALGCMGFAMMKVAGAVGFWNQNPTKWTVWMKAHFALLCTTGFWVMLNAPIIIIYLATHDIAGLLAVPFEGNHSLWVGNIPIFQSIWTLLSAVLTLLCFLIRTSDENRNRLHIVGYAPSRAYQPVP